MHWSDAYLSVPYAEANCAELVALALRDVFGIDMQFPSCRASMREQARTIESNRDTFARVIDDPHDGCGVLIRTRARLVHVGLWCEIGGTGYVLHSFAPHGYPCRHTPADLERLGQEIAGFYAWRVHETPVLAVEAADTPSGTGG